MIDLKKPYLWDSINDQIKEKLSTPLSVRFYQSLSQALLETVMAFQNLYSHKRQFNFLMGLGTHADEALLFLSRQGIKAIDLRTEILSDDKKTLFCVQDLDDAITAESYRDFYPIDEKIFRVNISHHLHAFEKNLPEVRETDVLIMNFGDHGAVALHGKRCSSLPSALAPTLAWSHQPQPQIPWEIQQQNPAWVAQIESSGIAGSNVLPNLSAKRIFDRALLTWLDLEGEALRQILIRDENINPNHLESLSLSRWNELKLIPQFEKRGWSAEMFRGTLILSAELSVDASLKAKIETSVKKLRSRGHL
jgi:hypothetical protein